LVMDQLKHRPLTVPGRIPLFHRGFSKRFKNLLGRGSCRKVGLGSVAVWCQWGGTDPRHSSYRQTQPTSDSGLPVGSPEWSRLSTRFARCSTTYSVRSDPRRTGVSTGSTGVWLRLLLGLPECLDYRLASLAARPPTRSSLAPRRTGSRLIARSSLLDPRVSRRSLTLAPQPPGGGTEVRRCRVRWPR
jgi:hypothetical protein